MNAAAVISIATLVSSIATLALALALALATWRRRQMERALSKKKDVERFRRAVIGPTPDDEPPLHPSAGRWHRSTEELRSGGFVVPTQEELLDDLRDVPEPPLHGDEQLKDEPGVL